MAEVVVFHHALGLTEGVTRFADALRAAGHTVHAPDLYGGTAFTDLTAGVAFAQEVGFEVVADRGVASVEPLPTDLVYAGFSLGVIPAQRLAQTRPGARGALLYHSAIPPEAFGDGWPPDVPVQIHQMAGDPWAEEDAEAIAALRDGAGAEVFEYPGSGHLFVEPSIADHDPEAVALLIERTLAFLARVG